MKKILPIAISIFLFLGCNKNKPKIGDYEARFYCNQPNLQQFVGDYRYQESAIVEVNNTEISISIYDDETISSILTKDGKIISGTFIMPGPGGAGGPSHPSNEIYITGTWKKENGKYKITGFHQYIYYDVDVQSQEINEYVVSGEFEIKSK